MVLNIVYDQLTWIYGNVGEEQKDEAEGAPRERSHATSERWEERLEVLPPVVQCVVVNGVEGSATAYSLRIVTIVFGSVVLFVE